jgi:iron complex transport system substrate-binding protein
MRLGWLLALLLGGCSGGPAIAPNGIVSANPCIDAVLAEIAAPGQIAAVSAFSHNADSASAPLDWARKHPAVGITAEEIIAAKPRLLLTGNLASTGTNAALSKAGIKMVTFGVPATVEESIAQVREIAKAIGRQEAGEALVARIERALKSPSPSGEGLGVGTVSSGEFLGSQTFPTPTPPLKGRGFLPSALIWQAGGFVPGKGTLQDELLARAGFINASAAYGLKQWDQLALETMILMPPAVIFMAGSAEGDDARALAMRKRMIARLGGKARIVTFPDKLLFCGGPTIIDVMGVLYQKPLPFRGGVRVGSVSAEESSGSRTLAPTPFPSPEGEGL